jgi:hypothetical protein
LSGDKWIELPIEDLPLHERGIVIVALREALWQTVGVIAAIDRERAPARLADLENKLVSYVKNANMTGLLMDNEPTVVERLIAIIEGVFQSQSE